MYCTQEEIELGSLNVSAGSRRESSVDGPNLAQKPRSAPPRPTQPSGNPQKQSAKTATTGGGTDGKKTPYKPPTGKYKKLVLVSGVLLCLVSVIAIIMVLSGNYGPDYNRSVPQFDGEIQMEEMNDEFITWDEDYRSMTSAKAQELTQKLSTRLKEALAEEGIYVDQVSVTELNPVEPKTITTNLPVEDSASGRMNGGSGYSVRGAGEAQTFKPEELQSVKTQTIEHPGISFVTAKFSTSAVPSQNTAVFMASNGRWSKVSNVVQSRMASMGMGVSIGSMHAQPSFMNSVQLAAQANPALARPPPQQSPLAEPCECVQNGFNMFSGKRVCKCTSSCQSRSLAVFGGLDNQFSVHTTFCLAAFYAGLTSESGGTFEVIITGTGPITAGSPKNGITPKGLHFDFRRFTVKSLGPVIKPAGSIAPTNPPYTNQQATHSTGNAMFTIHVLCDKINGQHLVYNPAYGNVKNAQSQKMVSSIKPQIKTAIESLSFVTSDLVPVEIAEPPEKSGIIFGFDVMGNFESNVQNAVKLESTKPASLPMQMMTNMPHAIRGFRYSKEFIVKMTEQMKHSG